MANAYFGKAGGATSFPATQAIIFEKQFRKRFRDQSIIPLITNSEWKGKFKGTGTEIKIPVLPMMHTYKTVPGDSYRYQEPKATEETFVINRERAWGIHFISEDQMFAQFNITSPILEEQAKVNGEDIEFEMLSDIPSKCAPANTGDVEVRPVGLMGRILKAQRDQLRQQLLSMVLNSQYLQQNLGPKAVMTLFRPSVKDVDVNPDDVMPNEERLKEIEYLEKIGQVIQAMSGAQNAAAEQQEMAGAPPGVPQPEQPEPKGGVAERRSVA